MVNFFASPVARPPRFFKEAGLEAATDARSESSAVHFRDGCSHQPSKQPTASSSLPTSRMPSQGSLDSLDADYGAQDDIYFSQTQPTPSQNAKKGAQKPVNESWAALIPANPNCGLPRFDLLKDHHSNEHTFGRNAKAVDFALAFKKVSSIHCRIRFVEEAQGSSSVPASNFSNGHVIIEDLSSNGTYIDSQKIGKGNKTILESGNEVSFGPPTTDSSEDLRYIFRRIHDKVDAEVDLSIGGGLHELYDVRDKVGKGSFATVKRAICRRTGEIKAVKIMQKARFMSNHKTWLMLQREVDIMRALEHPHIVKYEACFEDDQMLYIVMDFVNGGDLLDFTIRRNGVSEEEGAEIARQICSAVAYLHTKGVCHRDLKPDNVLLTSGDSPIIKVSDFGLAKMVDAATFLTTQCGTPSYLAPEVVLQNRHSGYSFAVDAWSIGVIVYAILTNSSPFEEDEDEPLDRRMRNNRSPDILQLEEKGISEEGIDFMKRLMTWNPLQRMSVADALLHPWLAGAQHTHISSGSLSLLPPNLGRAAHRLQTTPSLARTSASARSIRSTSVASPNGVESDGEAYSQKLQHMRIDTRSPTTSRFNGIRKRAQTVPVESGQLSPLVPHIERNGHADEEPRILADDSQQENDSQPFGIVEPVMTEMEEEKVATGSADLRASVKRKAPPSSAFSSESSLSDLESSCNESSLNQTSVNPIPMDKDSGDEREKGNNDKNSTSANASNQFPRRQSSRIAKIARLE